MYKVLVVDDESTIRTGLCSRLSRCPQPLEVVGEADNGLTALDFVQSHPTDIVVCDIRMPLMDGLAFIRSLRETGSAVQVIVVSGHADFEYACEALRLGAIDYLLKPIVSEKLNAAVDKAVAETQKMLMVRDAGRADLEWTVNAVLSNNIDPTQQALNLVCFPLLLLKFYGMDKVCERAVRNLTIPNATVIRRFGSGELLIFPSSSDPKPVIASLVGWLQGACRVAWSRPGTSLSEMYREAELALELRFGCSGIFLEVLPKENPFRVREALLLALERCLQGEPDPKNLKEISGLFQQLCQPATLAGLREQDVRALLEGIDQKLRSQSMIWFKDKVPFAPCAIYEMANAEQAQEWLMRRFRLCSQALDERIGRLPVSAICAYLKKNHSQDITLRFLSERFGYSPASLSRMIKENTGMGFSRYLAGLRIEHAAELLLSTDLSITDVALSAGFYDHAYFCHVFRKFYSKTPQEYRKISAV